MELTLQSTDEFKAETDEKYAFRHRPVDLAHLARYTMGDSVLEREVLELFRRQSRIYFDKLCNAADDAAWREAARVLKSSARGAGAWQILATAETAERLAAAAAPVVRDELLACLRTQIDEADGFIASLLEWLGQRRRPAVLFVLEPAHDSSYSTRRIPCVSCQDGALRRP